MLKNKVYLFLGGFLLGGLCLGASVGVYKRLEYNKQGYCYKTGAKLNEEVVTAQMFKAYFKNQLANFGYVLNFRADYYKSSGDVYSSKLFLLPGEFSDADIPRLSRDMGDFSQAMALPNSGAINALRDETLASNFVAFEYFDRAEDHTKRLVSIGLITKGWVSQAKNAGTYQRLIKNQDVGFFNRLLGFGNYFYQHSVFMVDKNCCLPVTQAGKTLETQAPMVPVREVFQRQRFFAASNCGDILMVDKNENMFFYLDY